MTLSVAVAAPSRARAALPRSWIRAGGLVVALAVLALAVACSLAYGSKAIPLATVVDAFFEFDPTSNDHLIVRELRVPRTVIGLLVGGALGLAGAVMQGVTRNPLADPALLGVEAGASLAVVAGIAALGYSHAERVRVVRPGRGGARQCRRLRAQLARPPRGHATQAGTRRDGRGGAAVVADVDDPPARRHRPQPIPLLDGRRHRQP